MADKYDSYREALVVETQTVWPEGLTPPADRAELERRLHAEADKAAELEYVRLHTGFCRRITMTQADLDRLKP